MADLLNNNLTSASINMMYAFHQKMINFDSKHRRTANNNWNQLKLVGSNYSLYTTIASTPTATNPRIELTNYISGFNPTNDTLMKTHPVPVSVRLDRVTAVIWKNSDANQTDLTGGATFDLSLRGYLVLEKASNSPGGDASHNQDWVVKCGPPEVGRILDSNVLDAQNLSSECQTALRELAPLLWEVCQKDPYLVRCSFRKGLTPVLQFCMWGQGTDLDRNQLLIAADVDKAKWLFGSWIPSSQQNPGSESQGSLWIALQEICPLLGEFSLKNMTAAGDSFGPNAPYRNIQGVGDNVFWPLQLAKDGLTAERSDWFTNPTGTILQAPGEAGGWLKASTSVYVYEKSEMIQTTIGNSSYMKWQVLNWERVWENRQDKRPPNAHWVWSSKLVRTVSQLFDPDSVSYIDQKLIFDSKKGETWKLHADNPDFEWSLKKYVGSKEPFEPDSWEEYTSKDLLPAGGPAPAIGSKARSAQAMFENFYIDTYHTGKIGPNLDKLFPKVEIDMLATHLYGMTDVNCNSRSEISMILTPTGQT